MKRRDFIKSVGLGGLTLTLKACLQKSDFSDSNLSRRRPNIIFIVADDLGYGDLSCYGQKRFRTPNIDRIAAEGIRFTDHYSGSTVCAPSRCTLMTGLHTGHCQIRGNREQKPVGQFPLEPCSITTTKLLKQADYITAMFGKWGLGYPGSTGDPMNQGFDEFFGYNCHRNAHTYYPMWLYHNREKIKLDGKTYAHDLIIDKAFEFIQTNKDRPFFCYMPVTIPHAAMHAPKDKHDKWRKKLPEFDAVIGRYSGPAVQNPIAAFPAMVTHLDEQVGALMKLLKDLDIDDNTLVIFTSDNGPHVEGGHNPEFWDSNGPLRGIKRDLYEGGIRVPMVARWPGKIKPGTISSHLSAFWDVMPTLAELAEIQAPQDIDGISFVPTLTGDNNKQKKHEYLYWEFHRQGKQAVRKNNWKAIKLGVDKNPNAPLELYNLKEDISEQNNVADKYPEVVDEMDKIMKEAHVGSGDFKLIHCEK